MRIVGFGTCMIGGFPYNSNKSFFTQLINQLKLSDYNVEFSKVISLGGFPIDRAKKHLNKKVISLNPDWVIIQFGTTDVSIDVKKSLSKIFNIDTTSTISDSSRAAELINQPLQHNFFIYFLKYFFKNLLIKFFKIKPITPMDIYISSIEDIIDTLNKNNINVIILAPFIQLDNFANIRINQYIEKVNELKEKYNFHFLNCNTELKKYKKMDIFLCDGFHLTAKGHLIVANQLKEIFEDKF